MDTGALLYLFVVFFLLAWIAGKLPFVRTARKISDLSKSSLKTINDSGLPDELKQQVLLKNSGAMLMQSVLIVGCTLLLLALLYASTHAVWLQARFNPEYLLAVMESLPGILIGILAFAAFFGLSYLLRKQTPDESDYTFSSKLLHRLALQWPAVGEMAFDAEQTLSGKKNFDQEDQKPVFVTGLARSGTTMLMRYLFGTGKFRSLTYEDMPFVLMPGIWKNISGVSSRQAARERAHKDGIMVSFDSPEAFEEIFWRTFTGEEYIGDLFLKPQSIKTEHIQKFRRFVGHVLLSSKQDVGQERYLSKNNNNILRIGALKEAFPNAKIIVPYRHPLEHALSLFSQHEHFSKVQSEDPFSLDYMNWLGHFEFGLNQKPFKFEENNYFQRLSSSPKESLNYWLLSWINYYDHALRRSDTDLIFFQYEAFCAEPTQVLAALFEELEMEAELPQADPFTPKRKTADSYDIALLTDCMKVYETLNARFTLWYPKSSLNNE